MRRSAEPRRRAESGTLARLLKELGSWSIRCSGLPLLVRRTVAARRVSMLLYHDPEPGLFAKHLAYLAKRYRFIRLADLVTALERRDWSHIPRNALVVTFDDGLRRNFELLGLVRAYGLVPTIYVCTQIVGTGRGFWFLAVPDPEPLKRLEYSQRLARLRATTGFEPEREHAPEQREALSAEEIRLMREHVDFESHTRFHPVLTTCTDADCAVEIERSRREVEELVGRPCEHFSYPNGDWSERELALVKRAGYRSARTIDFGWNGPRTDPYRLKILGFTDGVSVTRLAADLTGIPGYLGRLVRGSVRGKYRPIVLAPEATAGRDAGPEA